MASSSWPGGIPDDRRRSWATRPPAWPPGVTPTAIGQGTPVSITRHASPTSRWERRQRRPRRRPRAPSPPTPTPSSVTSRPPSSGPSPPSSGSSALEVRVTNRQNLVFRGLDRGPAAPASTSASTPSAWPSRGPSSPGTSWPARVPTPATWPSPSPVAWPTPSAPRLEEEGLAEVGGVRTNISRLHELLRPAPRLRHRLLRRRAAGPRPGRSRLPDAARRLRRPGEDPLRRARPSACRPERP